MSANGVSSAGVSIAVYAWMEDIQLSGASVGYAMQADEYGEGCVSKPASWVAKAATYFENIPVIGTFATATRIGAGAVSAIASLFGFTNVPVISDTEPYRPEAFPKFSSSEIAFPVERLALDPKNELSVDPRIVGIDSGEDEMTINYLTSRESFLCTAKWSTTNLVDDILFWSRVQPHLYDNDGATNSKLYLTPLSFASINFIEWRGDIVFRFQIIASKYHKGKILINFDPTGYNAQNIGNTVATSNVVFTTIVDLGVTHEVEFCVPYQQATQFLTLRQASDVTNKGWAVNSSVPASYPPNVLYDNGFLTIRVLNTLTSPVLTSSVDIHVYVKGKNMEFANPSAVDGSGTVSLYAPQAEEGIVEDLSVTQTTLDNQYLTHYGENIVSLRTLLRRYELLSMEYVTHSIVASSYSYFKKRFYKMPPSPGYCSIGPQTANKIVGAGTSNYNYVNFSRLSFVSSAYLCYRGSINWSFNCNVFNNPFKSIRVYKDNINPGATPAGVSLITYDASTASRYAAGISAKDAGSAGQAVTNQLTQAGMNVQCPNFSKFKFQSTSTFNGNLGQVADGSLLDSFVLEGDFPVFGSLLTNAPSTIHSYVAAGTDFGLYYFVNVPTYYIYSSAPTAP